MQGGPPPPPPLPLTAGIGSSRPLRPKIGKTMYRKWMDRIFFFFVKESEPFIQIRHLKMGLPEPCCGILVVRVAPPE